MKDYIVQRIAELNERIVQLETMRYDVCREETLLPGSTHADDLRDNWHREENRRDALKAIDQSLAGAQQQLELHQRWLREAQ